MEARPPSPPATRSIFWWLNSGAVPETKNHANEDTDNQSCFPEFPQFLESSSFQHFCTLRYGTSSPENLAIGKKEIIEELFSFALSSSEQEKVLVVQPKTGEKFLLQRNGDKVSLIEIAKSNSLFSKTTIAVLHELSSELLLRGIPFVVDASPGTNIYGDYLPSILFAHPQVRIMAASYIRTHRQQYSAEIVEKASNFLLENKFPELKLKDSVSFTEELEHWETVFGMFPNYGSERNNALKDFLSGGVLPKDPNGDMRSHLFFDYVEFLQYANWAEPQKNIIAGFQKIFGDAKYLNLNLSRLGNLNPHFLKMLRPCLIGLYKGASIAMLNINKVLQNNEIKGLVVELLSENHNLCSVKFDFSFPKELLDAIHHNLSITQLEVTLYYPNSRDENKYALVHFVQTHPAISLTINQLTFEDFNAAVVNTELSTLTLPNVTLNALHLDQCDVEKIDELVAIAKTNAKIPVLAVDQLTVLRFNSDVKAKVAALANSTQPKVTVTTLCIDQCRSKLAGELVKTLGNHPLIISNIRINKLAFSNFNPVKLGETLLELKKSQHKVMLTTLCIEQCSIKLVSALVQALEKHSNDANNITIEKLTISKLPSDLTSLVATVSELTKKIKLGALFVKVCHLETENILVKKLEKSTIPLAFDKLILSSLANQLSLLQFSTKIAVNTLYIEEKISSSAPKKYDWSSELKRYVNITHVMVNRLLQVSAEDLYSARGWGERTLEDKIGKLKLPEAVPQKLMLNLTLEVGDNDLKNIVILIKKLANTPNLTISRLTFTELKISSTANTMSQLTQLRELTGQLTIDNWVATSNTLSGTGQSLLTIPTNAITRHPPNLLSYSSVNSLMNTWRESITLPESIGILTSRVVIPNTARMVEYETHIVDVRSLWLVCLYSQLSSSNGVLPREVWTIIFDLMSQLKVQAKPFSR